MHAQYAPNTHTNTKRNTTAKNNLAGSLPNELSLLRDLSSVSVYRNALVGTLPTTWSDTLVSLDVEENQLTGPAFAAVTTNKTLAVYRISSNRLTGTIPNDIFTANLTELWLANNEIIGTIPSALGLATDLTSLIVYQNRLTGTIPTTIGNLSKLQQLQAYANALTGTLPSGLFASTKLKDLRLEQNRFAGTIPTEIGKITAVQDLRMGENSFTGTLPSEIKALTNLGTCVVIITLFVCVCGKKPANSSVSPLIISVFSPDSIQ
jgi:hypothetical protein